MDKKCGGNGGKSEHKAEGKLPLFTGSFPREIRQSCLCSKENFSVNSGFLVFAPRANLFQLDSQTVSISWKVSAANQKEICQAATILRITNPLTHFTLQFPPGFLTCLIAGENSKLFVIAARYCCHVPCRFPFRLCH